MELKLEHVLLFLLFVFLFSQVKCNRLTEGFPAFWEDTYGNGCNSPADCNSS